MKKRTRFALVFGAIAALCTSVNVATAESSSDAVVTMHKGGYYGRLIGIRKQRAPKGSDAKASTVTPIGTGSTTEPAEVVPGRISIYNVGTGAFACLARVVLTSRPESRQVNDYRVTTDPGDPTHFEVSSWNTTMTVLLYEDVNGNGYIDRADKLRRKASVRTSKVWARRHLWLARQKDVVVNGTGTVVTPPPATGYPKGSVVSVNKRQGFTMGRIDYTVGTTTLAFNYPNVPYDSWGYEAFPPWYGATISEKVTFNDAKTSTKSVVAPASAAADASVTSFDSVDN